MEKYTEKKQRNQVFQKFIKRHIGENQMDLVQDCNTFLSFVADKTLEYLNKMEDSQLKKMWLDYGISRKTTKKVTMCVVYGLTQYRSRDYFEEHLEDMIEEGKSCPFVKDKEDEDLEIPSFLRNQEEDHDKKDKSLPYYCSFCGKSQHEVKKLIAGPTVFICDECTDLCTDIIKESRMEKKNK